MKVMIFVCFWYSGEINISKLWFKNISITKWMIKCDINHGIKHGYILVSP